MITFPGAGPPILKWDVNLNSRDYKTRAPFHPQTWSPKLPASECSARVQGSQAKGRGPPCSPWDPSWPEPGKSSFNLQGLQAAIHMWPKSAHMAQLGAAREREMSYQRPQNPEGK